MKNKDRIEQLEKQVAVLTNRLDMLEMKLNPLPTAAPPEWPMFKPFWIDGPNPLSTQITCKSGRWSGLQVH